MAISKANLKKAKDRYYTSVALGRNLYQSEIAALPMEDLKVLYAEVKANLSRSKDVIPFSFVEKENNNFQKFINSFFIGAIEAEFSLRKQQLKLESEKEIVALKEVGKQQRHRDGERKSQEHNERVRRYERVKRGIFMKMLKDRFGCEIIDAVVEDAARVAEANFKD